MPPRDMCHAHRRLNARLSVAIHYDTFPLADERYGQATDDLATALARHGVPPDRFVTLPFGEGRDV